MSPVVALLTTSIATAAAPNVAPAPNPCKVTAPGPAAATETPGAKRLGELPWSRHYLTVLRREHGCEVAVIRENGRNVVVPLPDQRGLQPLESGWRAR